MMVCMGAAPAGCASGFGIDRALLAGHGRRMLTELTLDPQGLRHPMERPGKPCYCRAASCCEGEIMMRSLTRTVLFLAACAVMAPAAGAADLKDGAYSFKVFRDGDQIGTHTLTARHEGGDLVLDIAVDIKVKVAFITAYRYEQTRREVWRDGRLIAFESKTNDDGKKAKTSGKLEGDMLVVTGPDGTQKVRPDM